MKVQGNLSPWLVPLFAISIGWFGHPTIGSSNSYHKVFLP